MAAGHVSENALLCIVYLVNGSYSEWSPWSHCSVTCGDGTQQRTRSCTNPPPLNGGISCIGPAREAKTCTKKMCTTPGTYFLADLADL